VVLLISGTGSVPGTRSPFGVAVLCAGENPFWGGVSLDAQEDCLMPSQISYEGNGSGVVVTWAGVVCGEELKKVNECIYAEAELEKLRYQIWDFTEADRVNLSYEDIRELAMRDREAAEVNPDIVVAIVGKRTLFVGFDALFHVYEQEWSGFKSRSFETLAEARKWVSSLMTPPPE
jgi:hypothetical protein